MVFVYKTFAHAYILHGPLRMLSATLIMTTWETRLEEVLYGAEANNTQLSSNEYVNWETGRKERESIKSSSKVNNRQNQSDEPWKSLNVECTDPAFSYFVKIESISFRLISPDQNLFLLFGLISVYNCFVSRDYVSEGVETLEGLTQIP